jgi:hypothetical protein
VTFGSRPGLVVLAASLVGCAGNEPKPRIDAVEPAQAYTDGDVRLTLTGAGFLPSFRLDPVSGERVATMEGFSGRVSCGSTWETLTDFGWVSPTQISANLDIQDPDDLAVGPCDVEIADPRGHKAVLPAGFFAMGLYTFDPVLTIVSPTADDPYAPNTKIHANVTAVDPPPGHMTALTWTYTEPGPSAESEGRRVTGICPFGPGSGQIDCTFDVTISAGLIPGTIVSLDITASDNAVPPNQARVDLSIKLSPRPSVSSVRPQTGGVAGGTNVVIVGSGFVPGSRAYFDNIPLIPDGGIVVDGQTITGYAPAHPAPGSVPVKVQSRLGVAWLASAFEYQPRPQIERIVPPSGTQDQEMRVQVFGTNFTRNTIIYLGQTLADATPLAAQSWQSATEIDGVVPGSRGQTTVWVFDAGNGWTRLLDGFSWIAP